MPSLLYEVMQPKHPTVHITYNNKTGKWQVKEGKTGNILAESLWKDALTSKITLN